MINRAVLTLVFTLSFMSYMTDELSTSFQIAAPALFGVLVFCKLLWSESPIKSLSSLLEPDALLFVVFLPSLVLATSLASSSENSFPTALVVALCLLLGRVYMSMVPIGEVMDAFSWSGIISVALLAGAAFSSLVKSIQTLERFSPFSFHPNLLAVVAAGYFCAMIWKFLTSGLAMKIVSATIAGICLVVVFFTSSRGSMVGLVFGSVVTLGLMLLRMKRERRLQFRWSVALISACILLSLGVIRQSVWVRDTSEFADKALAITDSDRGLDSGFTGRFDKWRATLNILSDGSWFAGKGIRSSDSMSDNLIDNSYLVVLYELGFIPLLLITARFCGLLRHLCHVYRESTARNERLLFLACIFLMTTFLVNNIVARYLFSVGNAFSLFCLLLFAAPFSRIKEGSHRAATGVMRIRPSFSV